jgi:hypothetical protein
VLTSNGPMDGASELLEGQPTAKMRPAIGTGTGGNEDICSGQRLGKRSPGWWLWGSGLALTTYPVNGQELRECGRASKWAASQRGFGA